MRVAFLGLGLIGGSIARALRAAPDGSWSTTAWTPRGAGPRAALAAGAIDAAAGTLEAAVDGADIVVLAAPPTECLALLDELAGPVAAFLGSDAVVTDTASTKASIVHQATTLGIRFVGGHPMAGRETTGFGSADATLFRGRPWVVVPGRADADAVARVQSLAAACGANPFTLDAKAHDSYVAAVSHMPLVVSAALVEAVAGTGQAPRHDWAWAEALAAGGWTSMTRLARGDATMGAGIAATNAGPIAARLRAVRSAIDEWIELLEGRDGPDEPVLHERFAAARARLLAGDPADGQGVRDADAAGGE
ncbi:MAG TPA: prephenate dehydrogenase/arogenate dehydrogenase family protein [Candidatus Limnocylindrales bacterium]|nr:prephenate dehydrogenase/arogenate dehydrogenase family protein [Candidatus Limnocylindrales bacterium]